ncbi:DUF1330 domain-containing protein [Goodfellowiella coeruleoviolacea]|uniref:Uncharacterized conserved protein, DUF1330 family n=1 Tax=Goodfellowiella coeruleoviolacea TaxID=334858 RepID=A0AAE3KKZ5_9PSEU|nr:DUF1330 domain-containing protein [Goodfellowiella coeruleoviolacea]MCP2165968.1 Uncharacterized conserved protein, DUF1330 family [Goodfellowiella coeruleoviolacea]
MTAYVIAHLQQGEPHPEVFEYMERVQGTFAPFGGRFIVHGGATPHVWEGTWTGDLVMVAFPDMAAARAWYDSPAYQEIKPLRTRHLPGSLILLDGVGPDYDAAATAAAMRARHAAAAADR